MFITKNV